MKAMLETLESRMLLSAGTAATPLAAMQAQMSEVLPAVTYTSPVARYTGTHTGNQAGATRYSFTLVIQHWNTTTHVMQFKLIETQTGGAIYKGFGTISGTANRWFAFQFPSGADIVTFTGKVAKTYLSAAGTYVVTEGGTQVGSGAFSVSR